MKHTFLEYGWELVPSKGHSHVMFIFIFVVPFKDCRTEQLHNTRLAGNNLGPKFSESFPACHKLCLAEAACIGFHFNTKYSMCKLFTSITGNITLHASGVEAAICKNTNC